MSDIVSDVIWRGGGQVRIKGKVSWPSTMWKEALLINECHQSIRMTASAN